jgi:hypothetical protein
MSELADHALTEIRRFRLSRRNSEMGQGLGLASISEARASACVSIYSLMCATLPSRTVMSKTHSSSNGLFVALIFPVATPMTRTRSPCATNSGGFGYFSFHLFGRLLKYSRQFRVPAVRAGQRPALARNDPLNIFGNQRQQILLIVAAHCCKEILHKSGHSFRCSSKSLLFPYIKCVRSNRTFRNHSVLGPNHTVVDRLLLLLEQILEDEATPSAAACVHQRATLVELSQA